MIIDGNTLKSGINENSVNYLAKLIEKHTSMRGKYGKLRNYYIGCHDILNRRKTSEGTANNKLVCNHAKYIVDSATAYLVGNDVTYKSDEDISALQEAYAEQDISNVDNDLVKSMGIYSAAYELIYANEDSKPISVALDAYNTFVVYDSDVEETPLFGVHYFKKYDVDGNCTGVECMVYDNEFSYRFTGESDNWYAMRLEKQEINYFGGVQIIEYKNNRERQGDFEQLIPLIDAYNVLQSDRVNDKEQFVDAFLFLKGIDIDSEQAKKLKEERILLGYDEADAKYLDKVLSESDVEILRKSIKEDIHRFSQVPDLSDESFGGNQSGVAIRYKLLGFEQMVKNKERYFAKSLRRRMKLYINYLSRKGSMANVPVYKIDITFTRCLPVNELEKSEMIRNLNGVVTSKTLLAQLPFVSDPEQEVQELADEATQKLENEIKRVDFYARGGGYGENAGDKDQYIM